MTLWSTLLVRLIHQTLETKLWILRGSLPIFSLVLHNWAMDHSRFYCGVQCHNLTGNQWCHWLMGKTLSCYPGHVTFSQNQPDTSETNTAKMGQGRAQSTSRENIINTPNHFVLPASKRNTQHTITRITCILTFWHFWPPRSNKCQ